MRYGIFSDVHSNLEALEAVVEAYKKEAIDQYLCVGDVVGYAANPKECAFIVKSLAAQTVAGNHDWAAVGLFSTEFFNPHAKNAILWTAKQLPEKEKDFFKNLKLVYTNEHLTLVHGTLSEPEKFGYIEDLDGAQDSFWLQETDICFIGHTHVPGVFVKDNKGKTTYSKNEVTVISGGCKYLVNVGSVGQPRDDNPKASYCIFDTTRKKVYIKRLSYDIKKAQDKIFSSGLPLSLANRLEFGT